MLKIKPRGSSEQITDNCLPHRARDNGTRKQSTRNVNCANYGKCYFGRLYTLLITHLLIKLMYKQSPVTRESLPSLFFKPTDRSVLNDYDSIVDIDDTYLDDANYLYNTVYENQANIPEHEKWQIVCKRNAI